MILSIKEENLTVNIEFPEIDEVKPSAADVHIGAYDVISRVFSQEAVIGAYCSTDPTQWISEARMMTSSSM